MNLTNLRTLVRAITPGAKTSNVKNPLLNIVINSIVVDIAAYTKCLKTNAKFTITAEDYDYSLSSVLTDFLVPDKPGLWWDNGTRWKKLNPRTLEWLDKNKPNWRDLDSDDPQDYSIDGDVLTLSPTPDTTLTDGLWMYYGEKPVDMTSGDHYPFSGSTTEIPHLSIFDWAIVYGSKWKILPMINLKYADEYNRDKNQYLNEREEKFNLFKRRPDISAEARFQGPKVRS